MVGVADVNGTVATEKFDGNNLKITENNDMAGNADTSAQYTSNGYSYVGDKKNDWAPINVNNNTSGSNTLVVGDELANKSNNNINSGTNTSTVKLSDVTSSSEDRYYDVDEVVKFDENLNKMSQSGQTLAQTITSHDNSTAANLLKIQAVANAVSSGKYTSNDVITLNLSSSFLSDWNSLSNNENTKKLLRKIVEENKNHTNIVINVIPDTSNDYAIAAGWSSYTDNCDPNASYVTWNFGNYSGKVSVIGSFFGNIIAPKATVDAGTITSGRVTANKLDGWTNKVNMALKGTTQTVSAERNQTSSASTSTASSSDTNQASSSESSTVSSTTSVINSEVKEDTKTVTSETSEQITLAKGHTESKDETLSDKTVTNNDGSTTRTQVIKHTIVEYSDQYEVELTGEEKSKVVDGQVLTHKYATDITTKEWTETLTTTTKKGVQQTVDVKKMTNEENYSTKKIYTTDSQGNVVEANQDETAKTKDYLDKQNITSNEVIYAHSYDQTIGHIDGNIAVENFNVSTNINNHASGQYKIESHGENISTNVGLDYAKNTYSYIGKVSDGVKVDSNTNEKENGKNVSVVVFGNDQDAENNASSLDGSANHFNSTTVEGAKQSGDSRFNNLDQLSKIDSNLTDIGNAGQALIDSSNVAENGYQALVNVGNVIASGNYTNNDVVSVTVSSDIFTDSTHANDWQNNGVFNKLYNSNANKGNTNIIINVKVKDGVTNIDLGNIGNALMNATQSYSSRAAYVTWNFGNL